MDKIQVKIIDLVSGTTTNEDGVLLFNVIDRCIQNRQICVLSFEDMPPMSSSFMNSSFGELARKFGPNRLKRHLLMTRYKQRDVNTLAAYFERIKAEPV